MKRFEHHQHTARLRPHSRTSYPGLAFLLLLVGVVLMTIGNPAGAANGLPPELTVPENPISGAVGVTATVAGPPPTTGATILNPRGGARTSVIPITISGICPRGLLVSIYKNDVFAGATTCTAQGSFSLLADLFDGANTLVAKVTDSLGQSGPDSAGVNVFYDAPSLSLPGSTLVGRQLFLQTDTPSRGGAPGAEIPWSLRIVGGTPPYALSWDWGDGTSSLVSRPQEGVVTTRHTYERPGIYRIVAKVTDASGNSAYLQLVMTVNGTPETAAPVKGGLSPGILITAWPLYVFACLMVAAFWLGEMRELVKLRRRHRLIEGV